METIRGRKKRRKDKMALWWKVQSCANLYFFFALTTLFNNTIPPEVSQGDDEDGDEDGAKMMKAPLRAY
jgi:hypothetical protein